MKVIFIILFLLIDTLCFSQSETTNWFEFKPSDYFKTNNLDLSNWFDKPAGKHGFLQMKGKDYVFEDGTPIKFWGVNIASHEPFSEADKVDTWVRLMTKYGINGVRFHKFTWDATDGILACTAPISLWIKWILK